MAKAKDKGSKSVCNLIAPVRVEHLLEVAQKMEAGETVTVGDVNGGRISLTEYENLWGKYDEKTDTYTEGSMNAALYAGKPSNLVPSLPAKHQPVLLAAAKSIGMTFAGLGQPSRRDVQPENWPAHLPGWKAGYTINQSLGRPQTAKDIRRCVEDDRFIVKIGNSEYVIGDDGQSAIHVFHGSNGEGTYAFNVRAIKSLAFRGREAEIANLVFQINSKIVVERWIGDRTKGAELVFLPNMVATAGHLVRDGKELTPGQIVKAIESENTTGIRFKALSEPIVGSPVSKAALVAAVKKSMSAKATLDDANTTAWDRFCGGDGSNDEGKGDAVWYNASVQTRNNPASLNCFGLRSAALHMPIVMTGDRHTKHVTCIIGIRCGDEFARQGRETAEVTEAADEAEVVVEAEAKPKRKAAKADKADKPKAKKEKKGKSKSKKDELKVDALETAAAAMVAEMPETVPDLENIEEVEKVEEDEVEEVEEDEVEVEETEEPETLSEILKV
jgi:hypothetical protein